MKSAADIIAENLKTGKPLAILAVSKLRAAENEQALRANASNIVKRMLQGSKISAGQLSEVERYYPEQAKEYKAAGGAADGTYSTCTAISRRIGISQPALYKLLHSHADAPKPTVDGKYESNAVVAWYYGIKDRRERPTDLKEQALIQDVRLKKAKADIAEGKAIPREEVEALFMSIYTVVWSALKQNAERYGTNKEEALNNARAAFAEIRQKLQELSSLDE